MVNYLNYWAKIYTLDVFENPGNAIVVYLCYNKFNRLQIEVFFLPNISPPLNIGPSNLSFVRIYAQGVLTGFYGILIFQIYHQK